jgi:hypothetical protein
MEDDDVDAHPLPAGDPDEDTGDVERVGGPASGVSGAISGMQTDACAVDFFPLPTAHIGNDFTDADIQEQQPSLPTAPSEEDNTDAAGLDRADGERVEVAQGMHLHVSGHPCFYSYISIS